MHDGSRVAFLADWGNSGLDFTKRETKTHFIVTALTLPQENVSNAEEVAEEIRKKYFNNGCAWSDEVGKNHSLRTKVLTELVQAPFWIFALVVDKRQLVGEGLRYRGSFYKFLHGLADRELYRIFPDLQMLAAPKGNDSFMEGFVKYVHRRHIPNIFNQAAFGFANREDQVLVLAAEFVAETLAHCYDETLIGPQRHTFTELLQPKILTMKFWPDAFEPSLVTTDLNGQQYNATLADLSVNLATDYVHRRAHSPAQQVIDQTTCLSYLVFHFRHMDPTRYIASREIMEHIRVRRGKAVSLHYFQTKVIAPLRDAGILIASSSRGYKLPACEADLYDFVNHSNTIVQPMLSRVKKFRDQVRLATDGRLDLLDREEYGLIRKVLD